METTFEDESRSNHSTQNCCGFTIKQGLRHLYWAVCVLIGHQASWIVWTCISTHKILSSSTEIFLQLTDSLFLYMENVLAFRKQYGNTSKIVVSLLLLIFFWHYNNYTILIKPMFYLKVFKFLDFPRGLHCPLQFGPYASNIGPTIPEFINIQPEWNFACPRKSITSPSVIG